MKRHGMTGTPTWYTWRNMKLRCGNPNHHHYDIYGGRGIKVCERWQRFENFLADMGQRPDGRTIDRINNDGNYEPGNCRWATREEQEANKGPPNRPLGPPRRTHCKRGHSLVPENILYMKNGRGYLGRRCRACSLAHDRVRSRKWRARRVRNVLKDHIEQQQRGKKR